MVVGIVGVGILFFYGWPFLQRSFRAESIQEVADYLRGFGIWTPLISTALMIAQAVVAPLPSPLIIGANGIIFGLWWGGVLSWVGGMMGAVTSFWLARAFGQSFVSRFVDSKHLQQIDQMSETHGFWIVFFARLTPIISMDFIGSLAGLSRMGVGRYLLANAIGLLPSTIGYTILGHDLVLADGSIWRFSVILLVGGFLYLIGRWWLRSYRNRINVGAGGRHSN